MTVESDIDDQVAKVTIRKDKAIRVKGDLDALVTEGTSIAALTTTTAVSTLAVRTEATSLSTAATGLATSAVGASSFADLSALAASKSETATDVFIYDTSLDSDGGAWRFRTQGTSWYNETLNTAIRGSRREFPAVAVVVATSSTVTIYDGDTPGLPMWMVFNAAYGTSLDTGNSVRTVWAVNAVLTVGSQNAGLGVVNWLADHTTRYRSNNSPLRVNAISGRAINGALGISGPILVSSNVNDVAMTVLPNAPIDSATGLPIPTIAVATNGGISLIKDNETVQNSDLTNSAWNVVFDPDNLHLWAIHTSTPYSFFRYSLKTMLYSDTSGKAYYNTYPYMGNPVGNRKLVVTNIDRFSVSDPTKGFFNVLEGEYVNITTHKDLLSQITASYTTGWMPGDIKGAWLADTSDADLLGGNLVKNGNFDAADGWSVATGTGAISNGSFVSVGAFTLQQTLLSLIPGVTYKITLSARTTDVGSVSTIYIVLGGFSDLSKALTIGNTSGEAVRYFVAGSTDKILKFFTGVSNVIIDNVTVQAVDNDRSVNANPLTVVGRIQRTPVADNADLVWYTGFSATNYLEQPYNSGLDFGTGDFSIMGWARTNMNGTILSRGDGITAGSWFWYHLGGITTALYIHDGTTLRLAMNLPLPSAEITHFTLVRRSGKILLYGNGQLVGSSSEAYQALSMTNTTAKLRIGEQQHVNYVNPASRLTLLRISATAPSADQIAKMFKDERKMFEPGARCTLYGASDAVTGLAYDKVTNLLHAGTSAGRSVFDGLVRVSNTTTPVRAVIAAHGGLVIED